MTKTFEKLEQYKLQNDGVAKTRAVYEEKVRAAVKAVEAEKIKLDELVHVELATRTDKKTEKAAARKAIEQKEKDLEYAKEEQATADQFFSEQVEKIKVSDVVFAFIREYSPAAREEHLPGLQARIKQGEDMILSAIYDFKKLQREYEEVANEVKPLSKVAKESGETDAWYPAYNPFEQFSDIGFDASALAEKLTAVRAGEELPEGTIYYKEAK